MSKVGTGIGITLGLVAIAGGAVGGLKINKQNKDLNAKSAEIVKVTEDYQNSKDQVILLQSDNKKYEEQLAQKDEVIDEMNATIESKNAELQNKDATIAEQSQQLTQKNEELVQKNTELSNKDATITEKNQQLTQKDEVIASMNTTIAEQNVTIQSKETIISEKNQQLIQKDQQIQNLQESTEVVYSNKRYDSIRFYANNLSYTIELKDGNSIASRTLSAKAIKEVKDNSSFYLATGKEYTFTKGEVVATVNNVENNFTVNGTICNVKYYDENGLELGYELIETITNNIDCDFTLTYTINDETSTIETCEFGLILKGYKFYETAGLIYNTVVYQSPLNSNFGYYSFNEMNNGISGFHYTNYSSLSYYTTTDALGSEGVYSILQNSPSITVSYECKTNGTDFYLEFTKEGETSPTLLKLDNFNYLGA